ncbi:MAG TPA: aldehyde dehydrogenase family protein [Dongiaceae bacterium]
MISGPVRAGGIFAAIGQTCMAGSRLLVPRSMHNEVVARIAECAKTIGLGMGGRFILTGVNKPR